MNPPARSSRSRTLRGETVVFLAATEDDADLYYATRFLVPDPLAYVELGGKSWLLVKDLELGRARREATVDHVAALSPYQDRCRELELEPTLPDMVHLFLEDRRAAGDPPSDPLLVPASFPLGSARRFEELGHRLQVMRGSQLAERAVKSESEVAAIERSQQAAEKAVRLMIDRLAESSISDDGLLRWRGEILTAERLRNGAHKLLLDLDCIATETIVACGDRGCDPHDRGSGPIRAGETIVLDVFPRSVESRYWGDITRTVVRGRAKEGVRELYQDVLAAQELVLGKLRPGIDGKDLHQAVIDFFESRGRPTEERDGVKVGYFHGTGHGVGLAIHEAPSLGRTSSELRAGQVITVEPGLYYPGLGAVRIEDTVLITPEGHRNLTAFPKGLDTLEV